MCSGWRGVLRPEVRDLTRHCERSRYDCDVQNSRYLPRLSLYRKCICGIKLRLLIATYFPVHKPNSPFTFSRFSTGSTVHIKLFDGQAHAFQCYSVEMCCL